MHVLITGVLFAPGLGSLKYTLSAVASICALNIALQVLVPHVATLMTLKTYWKGTGVARHHRWADEYKSVSRCARRNLPSGEKQGQ